jgi:hypothetical protein
LLPVDGSAADWALLGQALMSMPQLQVLDLSGECLRANFRESHFMTDNEMDDECFMALAEGLTALNMLEKLHLRGLYHQVSLPSCDLIRTSTQ